MLDYLNQFEGLWFVRGVLSVKEEQRYFFKCNITVELPQFRDFVTFFFYCRIMSVADIKSNKKKIIKLLHQG